MSRTSLSHRWSRFGAAIVAALGAACSVDSGDSGPRGSDGAERLPEQRPWATGPRVEAVLEATSSDDLILSGVSDIAVDSRGMVYVKDWQEDGIIGLNADLTLERTIGRRGEGPGEFNSAFSIQVLAGDSLLVWDSDLQRTTVFPPESDEPALVRPLGTLRSSRRTLRMAGSSGHIALSSMPYMASGSDEGAVRTAVIRHVREDGGQVVDEVLFEHPADELLVLRAEGMVSVGGHPFGRRSFAEMLGGDRMVQARSDALEVRIIDLDGRVEPAISYRLEPTAVTRQELDGAADELTDDFARALREGAPYDWPILIGLSIDEQERIWVGIRGRDPSVREWAAFTTDGTHLMSVALPAGFEVHAVRGGRIVGVSEDELGVPRVMAYRLAELP